MASAAKYNRTYGNVAFDTAVRRENGDAAQKPERRPQLHELPMVRPRPRSQAKVESRVRVALRPQEEYSFLPAVGFLAAAFLAVMVLTSYNQLNAVYAETVEARSQLTALEQEEDRLLARYEEVFDQAALQEAVAAAGSTLTEARNEQKVYVDLSEPDSAVVYEENSGKGLLEQLKDMLAALRS